MEGLAISFGGRRMRWKCFDMLGLLLSIVNNQIRRMLFVNSFSIAVIGNVRQSSIMVRSLFVGLPLKRGVRYFFGFFFFLIRCLFCYRRRREVMTLDFLGFLWRYKGGF